MSNLLLLYLLKSCLIIEEKVISPVNPIDIAIEKVFSMSNKEYPFSALFFKWKSCDNLNFWWLEEGKKGINYGYVIDVYDLW